MCKKSHTPIPNAILRSALFGVVEKGSRKFEKNILKATVNGYTIKYTGEQLDQADLDVWMECLRRSQTSPLGYTVRFSARSFLESIARNTGKSDHEWLKTSLTRMMANSVLISDGKYTYQGSLIDKIYRDEENMENCLIMNPDIATCFSESGWTGIDKVFRLQLKGKPLTQWLHGFYSSHAKPLPIKVATIRELCGSEIAELRMFRFKLRKSLAELRDSLGWSCEIDNTDKVIISKKLSKM